jgi:hypothetical protein
MTSAEVLRDLSRRRRAARMRARRAQAAYRAWLDGDRSVDVRDLLVALMRTQDAARQLRVLTRRALETHLLLRSVSDHVAAARSWLGAS